MISSILSVPKKAVEVDSQHGPIEYLSRIVTPDHGAVFSMDLPHFRVRSLDILMSEADELAKLDRDCKEVLGRVGDTMKTIFESDAQKVASQKRANNSESTLLKDWRVPAKE